MSIKATNIIVGGEIRTSPQQKPVEKQIKKRVAVEQPQQVTKELPKYVEKEDGLLVRKINTKSSYMRDIFDLDS